MRSLVESRSTSNARCHKRSSGCAADHSCPGFVEESSRLLKDTLLAVILTEGFSGSNLPYFADLRLRLTFWDTFYIRCYPKLFLIQQYPMGGHRMRRPDEISFAPYDSAGICIHAVVSQYGLSPGTVLSR